MINTNAFQVLTQLAPEYKKTHLKTFFTEGNERFEEFHIHIPGMLYDFSKQKVDHQIVDNLLQMAEEMHLSDWIEKLFSGEKINASEGRAAWHTALRDIETPLPEVSEQWRKMETIVHELHNKQLRGYEGSPITDVVNIGVGGSDLGPLMITHALEMQKHPKAPHIHFVSTLDARQLEQLLAELNPATTLFVVASKSFTTIDTLSLADTAKFWIQQSTDCPRAIQHHFIGISANPPKMTEWGIAENFQLNFWDWVGGRYSMWSAIGLTIALELGMEGFKDLLAGAHAMDTHFRTAPFKENIPVMVGLIGVWNTNFLDLAGQAILPYDSRLKYFASYLEQLEMESNGKHVRRNGEKTSYRTCPILWGEVGPNAQHAFYQLLHQGTEKVMADFILFIHGQTKNERGQFHHNLNIANCLAQSRAMMIGQDSEDPNKVYPGDQVSNTILMNEVNAYQLGMLVSLYEHKVFVQSVMWDINPFDQWGVELGKKIALDILNRIQTCDSNGLDSSTVGILKTIWKDNNEC
ncbi:glucose-6-phosphate isomerase [Thiomicrorhabdus sp.]|uniref:glucose-6-phosphate isomerase n=1 Tax=Thiomicrorhabdus sp. TaxID=2039724 RepID=UPI0029C900D5|nr:glucose-6-phosphate isomerase [Thiomicrorhabdus sp.]